MQLMPLSDIKIGSLFVRHDEYGNQNALMIKLTDHGFHAADGSSNWCGYIQGGRPMYVMSFIQVQPIHTGPELETMAYCLAMSLESARTNYVSFQPPPTEYDPAEAPIWVTHEHLVTFAVEHDSTKSIATRAFNTLGNAIKDARNGIDRRNNSREAEPLLRTIRVITQAYPHGPGEYIRGICAQDIKKVFFPHSMQDGLFASWIYNCGTESEKLIADYLIWLEEERPRRIHQEGQQSQ